MSQSNFYSGIKFLGDALLRPTSLFKSKNTQNATLNDKSKKNSVAGPISQSVSDLKEDQDKVCLTEPCEPYERAKNATHKSRQEVLSNSTATSQQSLKKPGHTHTKSLMIMIDNETFSPSDAQDNEGDGFESSGAPLLFSKGGYETHINTKELIPPSNSLETPRTSGQPKRKGGFLILENGNLDEIVVTKKYHTPQARMRRPGSSFFPKLSKETSLVTISENDDQTDPNLLDPLSSSRVTLVKKENTSRNGSIHTRFPSGISIEVTETSDQNSCYEAARPMTTKEKFNFSPIWEDLDTQDPISPEKYISPVKNGQNSFCDLGSDYSKRNSVIVLPDQINELEIDFGDNEIESSPQLNTRVVKSNEGDNQIKDRLIREYKMLQKKQLHSNGIYIIPTSDTFVWNCLIFIRGGYYQNAKFKFHLNIPTNYPSGYVRVYSLTKIYHPLVNIETGEVDLKLCDRSPENQLENVITFIKSIFNESKYLEKLNSFNHDAGLKFSQNPYYFKLKAKESTKLSEKNTLNENKDDLPEILSRVESLKGQVTSIAMRSIKFEDKVQSLIQSVKQSVKKN